MTIDFIILTPLTLHFKTLMIITNILGVNVLEKEQQYWDNCNECEVYMTN